MRIALAFAVVCAMQAAETRTIPNVLGQDWPWELISMDFAPGAVKPDWVATIEGVEASRPLQIEHVQVDGKAVERVWFIATLGGKQKQASVTFAPGSAVVPLAVREDGGFTVVDNGLAELRLRLGGPPAGTSFAQTPHWLGGVRVKGSTAWDGRAVFHGTSPVAKVAVQNVAKGPVFAEWRLSYEFADNPADGTVEAVPLMLGKHSFRFPPNRIPTEAIPRQPRRYDVGIRVVANDPWIEVVERYRLPRDPAVKNWGIHQTMLTLGKPEKDAAPVPGFAPGEGTAHDTVLWMRWFEYDAFGGNTSQLADPARPRAVQKGRPFAQMRARWSQGPAGSQDVIMTSGGTTALPVAEMRRMIEDRLKDLRRDAAKPEDKRSAKLKDHQPGLDKAAALAAAATGEDDAARTALTEAGGLIGITMPAGVGYRPDAPAIGIVAAYPTKWVGAYAGTIMMQASDDERGVFRFPLIDGDKDLVSNAPIHYGGRCYAIVAGRRDIFDSTGRIESLIRRHSDWTLTAQVNRYLLERTAKGETKGAPNPMMYLNKRYQCDDVNPTNYGNRRLVNDGFAKNLDKGAAFGASQVAVGYIYSDLDAWPGWHNGWGPGNPNFHTDKYMGAIYAAVTMADHPHAKDWLAFGRSCLDEDLAKVFLPPDGVGSECPGYSGYSLGLQAEVGMSILNANLGNPLAENPLVAKSVTWHRKLLTPFDRRLGLRHEAPIGDTHRWTSGLNFEHLIPFYEKEHKAVAEELRLAHHLFKAKAPGGQGAEGLDWSSQAFKGFGAVLRHAFGTPQESFLSLKSGSAGGHYHNEDQTFHWYHRGTPISLDYNCSYHPRGDHAALHNGITLGVSGTVKNNARNVEVEAIEQPFGPAGVVQAAFAAEADVVVADRLIRSLSLSPLDPHDGEFNRDYPSRKVEAHHRRLLLLAKHGANTAFSDYLVVRDEIRTDQPQQVNLHLLAYEAKVDGDRILLSGQYDQDILVQIVEATAPKVEVRHWAYIDEWMAPPEEFLPTAGETVAAWDARLPKERPTAGWKPTYIKREEIGTNEKRWHEALKATDGLALAPPPGWNATWTFGEMQRWLRISTAPGTPVMLVVYPYAKAGKPPTITRDGDAIVIEAGGKQERVSLSSARGASLGGKVLMPAIGEAAVGENTPQLPR